MFITFEGIEGCGKTTQTNLLFQYLKSKNISSVLTREPGGGSDFALKIRETLKNTDGNLLLSELLAIYGARNEHIKKLIKPSLNEGKVVISDRYIDSSFAYYLYDKLIIKDKKIIKTDEYYKCYNHIIKLNEIIEIIEPDITFLFDIDIEESNKRIKARNLFHDKYDDLGNAQMSLISYIFNDIYEETEKRRNSETEINKQVAKIRKIFKINATQDIENVFEDIKAIINTLLCIK